jgi:hypothetical protein
MRKQHASFELSEQKVEQQTYAVCLNLLNRTGQIRVHSMRIYCEAFE